MARQLGYQSGYHVFSLIEIPVKIRVLLVL